MADYPHLGFDPVESDYAVNDDIARELREAVRNLGVASDALSGTGDQAWQGETAGAFRDSVDSELRPRVKDAYHSFSTASRALDRWVEELPEFRRRADALEEEAATAAQKVSAAAKGLSGLTKPTEDAEESDKTKYDEDRRTAKGSLSNSQDELDGILSRARTLHGDVVSRAGEVSTAFNTAVDQAPDEPGLFGKAGDLISDIGDALSAAFDWVMENVAPILQKLAKIVGAVCAILSVVAFVVGFVFPPAFALAGTLGTIAKVASFVDIGIQGLRVLHGEDGALQGLALQGVGMLAGIGAARLIGPIATNATNNIRNGLMTPQLAYVGVGTGGSAVAAQSIAINPDFYQSLAYWGVASYRDLSSSMSTLDEETR